MRTHFGKLPAWPSRRCLLAWGTSLALSLALFHPVAGQDNSQPAGKHSTLIDDSNIEITDSDFASWLLQGLTTSDHKSNVKDVKILFQECYGGGMLNRVGKRLKLYDISFVGSSAANWNQCSYFDDIDAISPWTKQVVNQINANPNGDLLAELQTAKAKDPMAGRETPQLDHAYYAGVTSITLKDPKAKSHHAILWCGHPARGDNWCYQDIKGVLGALEKAWGTPAPLPAPGTDTPTPNTTVQILFGDGTHMPDGTTPLNFGNDVNGKPLQAQEASSLNLHLALLGLNKIVNPDEEFLFYATDHGGTDDKTLLKSGVGAESLSPDQVTGAEQNGAIVTLTVPEPPTGSSSQVKVQGQPVGEATATDTTFAMNPDTFLSGLVTVTTTPSLSGKISISIRNVDEEPTPSHGVPTSLTISGPTTLTPNKQYYYQATVTFADGFTTPADTAIWGLEFPLTDTTIAEYTGFLDVGNGQSGPATSVITAELTDKATTVTVKAALPVVIIPPSVGAATSITATSGGGQSTTVNAAFLNPLLATVKDAGSNPVAGVTVTFTGPASGAGVAATVTATTNASGVATATVTANATAGGPYTVTATTSGVPAPATYTLTNTAVPTLTLNPVSVGQNLEVPATVTIPTAAKSAVQVALTTSSSEIAFSATSTGTGAPLTTVTIPAGSTSAQFYVYGLGNSGTVTYVANASGFATGTGAATLTPSTLVLACTSPGTTNPNCSSGPTGEFLTASLSAGATGVFVLTDQASASGSPLNTNQPLAGGLSLTESFNNLNPSAGAVTPAQVTITGGTNSATAIFTPNTAQSTTIITPQAQNWSGVPLSILVTQ